MMKEGDVFLAKLRLHELAKQVKVCLIKKLVLEAILKGGIR